MCFNNLLEETRESGESVDVSVRFDLSELQDRSTYCTLCSADEPDIGKVETLDEHSLRLAGYCETLAKKAEEIGKYQKYEMEKQHKEKEKAESADRIVGWCVITQAVVVCALGAWQVWTLRRRLIARRNK